MPLTTWNYVTERSTVRHMGVMAQDFRAAFGLGDSDLRISTVDADGVAFAAIQGLHQLVQEKDAHIAALDQQVQSLRGELAGLKATVAELADHRTKVARGDEPQ